WPGRHWNNHLHGYGDCSRRSITFSKHPVADSMVGLLDQPSRRRCFVGVLLRVIGDGGEVDVEGRAFRHQIGGEGRHPRPQWTTAQDARERDAPRSHAAMRGDYTTEDEPGTPCSFMLVQPEESPSGDSRQEGQGTHASYGAFERGWRATFYTTGMEHSPTSA